ncbi:MAG: polynucleotide adenylyltransferase PcnB, partial [Comamonadaceae bacterium]
PYSLVEQARFRAAFDFMRLRADVGEIGEAIAEWWQEFSTADDLRRQDLMDQVRDEQKKGPRVRVRAPQAAAVQALDEPAAAESDGDAGVPPDGESATAPRKRRRRRKPRTGGGDGDAGGSAEGGGGAAEA